MELETIKEQICDEYCRFCREIKDESTLIEICEECPLNRMVDDGISNVNI